VEGLYIHVPFCVSKCAYCDFFSVPGRLELIDTYIDAVLAESLTYRGSSCRTLYLGGGTPSLLGADGIRKLIGGLRRTLNLTDLVEATIEVNPDSATVDLLKTAIAVGINRVSIGVQSLADSELKSVGRIHTAAQAIEAILHAGSAGFTGISADIIVGLPGQELKTLQAALESVVNLGVNHLSLYCLALEAGTPLATKPPDDLPSDDMQAELFCQASCFLKERGFIHYEISNFARPGYECQHNLNYWRGGEYIGLGPAAASHLHGRRFKNRANLEAYLKCPTRLVEDMEELGAREKAAEEAMLRLRLLTEGIDIGELRNRFGAENTEALARRLDEMIENRRLILDGSRYRLAPDRVLTSNPIFARVLGH
jgi:oxygen-independent coproporphyrinogen-3 oxidase